MGGEEGERHERRVERVFRGPLDQPEPEHGCPGRVDWCARDEEGLEVCEDGERCEGLDVEGGGAGAPEERGEVGVDVPEGDGG